MNAKLSSEKGLNIKIYLKIFYKERKYPPNRY